MTVIDVQEAEAHAALLAAEKAEEAAIETYERAKAVRLEAQGLWSRLYQEQANGTR